MERIYSVRSANSCSVRSLHKCILIILRPGSVETIFFGGDFGWDTPNVVQDDPVVLADHGASVRVPSLSVMVTHDFAIVTASLIMASADLLFSCSLILLNQAL